MKKPLLLLVAIGILSGNARAATVTDYTNPEQVQPYIETLRRKHDIKPVTPAPLPPAAPLDAPTKGSVFSTDPQEVQPYIEKLREKHKMPPAPTGLEASGAMPAGPAHESQPHIESIKKNPELEPKFHKTVNQAAGFSFVASNKFDLKSDKVQANSFESVYTPDEKYSPSVDIFYEYQFYRNHYVGALGAIAHVGVITTKGKGIFTRSGTASSDTEMRFYAVPVSVGGSYRFTQLRFVAPFIQLAALGIPMLETRNDDKPSRRGISRGFNVTGGLALNLDWIHRADAWAQYDNNEVLHTYLLVQLETLRTIAGPVAFNYNGTYLGLMFEF